MRYLIGYDIADDRRRDRVATTLLDFGQRLEESLFLVYAETARYEELLARLATLAAGAPLDRIHVVPICHACWGKAVIFGDGQLPNEAEFYIL